MSIYVSYMLNKLNISYQEIESNKNKVLSKIRKAYPKNNELIEIIEKLIILNNPPDFITRVNNYIYPNNIKFDKKFIGPDWNEVDQFLKIVQDFLFPSPELFKKFLSIEQLDPILDHIKKLMFMYVASAEKIDREAVYNLFTKALNKIKNTIEPEDSIIKSRFFEFIIGNINVKGKLFIEILKIVIRRIEKLNQLDEISKKQFTKEIIDILGDLLEISLKTLLGVIYNLKRIIKKKKIVPIDRTLGNYAKILEIGSRNNLITLRNLIKHGGYEIILDGKSNDIHIKFFSSKYKHNISIEKSFGELLTLIVIITASIGLFKMYMEAYQVEYIISKKNIPIDEIKKNFIQTIYNQIKDYTNKRANSNHIFEEGIAHYKSKNYDEALKFFNKSIEIIPEFAGSWYYKGLTLEKLGKYNEALECCKKALELAPQNKEIILAIGVILYKLKKYEDSLNYIDEALLLDPKFIIALNYKGDVLEELDKFDQALECYNKVLKISPKNKNALVEKGYCLINLKKFKAAIEYFDDLLKLNFLNKDQDFNLRVLYYKSLALIKLNQFNDAIKILNEILKIDPENFSAWLNKGYCLISLRDLDNATQCIEKALNINPNSHEAYYNMACIEALKNNKNESIRLLKIAIEFNNNLKKLVKNDKDFDNIKNEKEYTSLIND